MSSKDKREMSIETSDSALFFVQRNIHSLIRGIVKEFKIENFKDVVDMCS